MRALSIYAAMFEGLRGYYARYETRRADAGYHAAMTLSFFFCINMGSIITLVDYFVSGNLTWAVAFFQNKTLLILLGVASALAHVQFGKHTGRYNSVELARSSRWRAYTIAYAAVSFAFLIGAVIVAFIG